MRPTARLALIRLGGCLSLAALACGDPAGPEALDLPELRVETSALPAAARFQEYSVTLSAAGGDGTYRWSVVGVLTPGLTLSQAGELSGVPESAGTWTFDVEVTSAALTARHALSILVSEWPTLAPDEHCSDYPAESIVSFSDPKLEAVVREALDATTLPLTCGLVAGVEGLVGTGRQIVDLRGIQNLTALRRAWLDGNFVRDLAPLRGLADLTTLALRGSQFSDSEPLSELSGLRYLDLTGTGLTDVGALSGLVGLEVLYLRNNRIVDLSPLQSLVELEILSLAANRMISDLSPLAGLTQLVYLDVTNNRVQDVGPLAGLVQLRTLWLAWNSIRNISPLAGLTSLEVLDLEVNPVDDLSPGSGMLGLQVLRLWGTRIADLTPIVSLTALRELGLSSTMVRDPSAVGGLTGLRRLSLGGLELTDVGFLAGLTELESLVLNGNRITDLTPLNALTNLRYLSLYRNCALTNVQPLLDNGAITAGDELVLDGTAVSPEVVAALRAMRVLVNHYGSCINPTVVQAADPTPYESGVAPHAP